jgi:hypothetical protein
MAYKQLSENGKAFIRKVCGGTGNSLLVGKSPFKVTDPKATGYPNPNGVLPYCDPPTSPTKIWTANIKNTNGVRITTNQEFGELLILWYNKYGKIYEMDANVMAAQAHAESGYITWNYPLTSTASGIVQFINNTVFDLIISNKYSNVTPLFSSAEIALITNNIVGNKNNYEATYSVGSLQGKQNRPQLHQNVIDNPELMIKAQFRFMKYISNSCNALTSSTLFGYSRGPALATSSYADSIALAKAYTTKGNYHEEGVNYVYTIFKNLYNNFGYTFLEMSKTPDPNFDIFNITLK